MHKPERWAVTLTRPECVLTVDVRAASEEEARTHAADVLLGMAAWALTLVRGDALPLFRTAYGGDIYRVFENDEQLAAFEAVERERHGEGFRPCPECGEDVEPDANYCGHCACRLQGWCEACHQERPRRDPAREK